MFHLLRILLKNINILLLVNTSITYSTSEAYWDFLAHNFQGIKWTMFIFCKVNGKLSNWLQVWEYNLYWHGSMLIVEALKLNWKLLSVMRLVFSNNQMSCTCCFSLNQNVWWRLFVICCSCFLWITLTDSISQKFSI